jgi:UDP-N-acetylglucosamine 2-epimerase (non-hydrolysing)
VKVLTVLGTRPEIIRLSRVVARLDAHCDHVLVHTGQNHDECLNDVFFRDLRIRRPDHALGARGTLAAQVSAILQGTERLLDAERPDALLILGDTNSGLAAFVAKHRGIPVFHMEAGNRCYDDGVPEEVNRRVIDHLSDVLMPYTERSRQNLLREGIPGERVFVTGNPIYEVLCHHDRDIAASEALDRLGVRPRAYLLATLHRAETVDDAARLRMAIGALDLVRRELDAPLIVSVHPRTRDRCEAFGLTPGDRDVRFLPPFGFFDFVALERNALCVLTDSGTVQEECAIARVPSVTMRDVTERPETLEVGSNVLAGVEPAAVLRAVRLVLSRPRTWTPPAGYLAERVSEIAVGLVLGLGARRRGGRAEPRHG